MASMETANLGTGAETLPAIAVSNGPARFTPQLAIEICERLANGESLRRICDSDERFPTESAVRQWVIRDVQGFAAQYTHAREIGLDRMADELIEIADDSSRDTTTRTDGSECADTEWINRSRLRVDARKWHTSKISPSKYGDRLMAQLDATVTHQVKPDLSGLSVEAREELRNILIEQMRKAPKMIEGRVEVDE